MVVQHNLTAMNANRMLGVTTGQQAKSTEKLSSGYKINRAADDAAGLSISEKMRKQVRGLNQASSNAQDGISCVQTAEGALTEVHSMLQRMNELTVKASNGTMSKDDRQNVQDEIDALVTEIDRVSEATKFNETYLLKGNGKSTFKDLQTTAGVVAGTTVAAKNADDESVNITLDNTVTFGDGATGSVSVGGKSYNYANYENVDQLADAISSNKDVRSAGLTKTYDGTATAVVGTNMDVTGIASTSTNANTGVLSFSLKNAGAFTATAVGATMTVAGKTINFTVGSTTAGNDADTIASLKAALENEFGVDAITASASGDFTVQTAATGSSIDVNAIRERENLEFNLHVGSESSLENKIGVEIASMGSDGLGVSGLKVTTEQLATDAIDVIGDAIKAVSKQRSALGAAQNRLEHTISNLDNVSENTASAESRIRDTDMAKEMVEYSKNNILAQAGQSMLAQANQSTQGVLSLLG